MRYRQVLIVDDEELARSRLDRMIGELPGYEVCGQADNGETALKQAAKTSPDIVLLDIRMPGMDGMACAQQLSRMATPPALIFCTAYDDYALEAFQVQAAAYLVKPVRREALSQALERAGRVNRLQQEKLSDSESADERLSVRTHRGLELVDPARLYYAMADNKYVTLVHAEGETLCDYSLRELEKLYPQRLLRVHRNTVINTDYLVGLVRAGNRHQVRLSDGRDTHLNVSRRHAAAVREWLAHH